MVDLGGGAAVNSVHELAIRSLEARHAIVRRGFAKEVRDLLGEDAEGIQFGVVPDAWLLRPHPEWPGVCQVVAFEVEDTSRVGAAKLGCYLSLWWVMDSTEYLDLQLVTADRWGNESWIDMVVYAYAERSALRRARP